MSKVDYQQSKAWEEGIVGNRREERYVYLSRTKTMVTVVTK